MKQRSDKYTYKVTWSEDDKEFIGLCVEMPSLSWLAATQDAALRGIRKVVSEVIEDIKRNGEPIPEPIALKHYSGKFVVRVPSDVHRQLAMQAAESGVSINRLVSSKLSR